MCPVTTTSVTRVVAGTAAAGAAALAWGALVEPRLFTLRRFTVPVLPADALPVRVLQVSDIHMVPGQRAKTEWIRGLAALEPDLVVNTGDNLSHPRRSRRPSMPSRRCSSGPASSSWGPTTTTPPC